MLARLLSADPGDIICLEVFDDVGVEKADGTRIAEQSKSSLGYNPLADREVAFWKTIANWMDAIEGKQLNVATTHFELYVSRQVTPGSICSSYHHASSISEATRAIAASRIELWGRAPGFDKKKTVARTLAPHLERVFRHPDSAIAPLVARMRVVCGSGDPHADLKPLMTRKLVSEDAYEAVVRWALGWVKKETDQLIQRQELARINYDVFHRALLEHVRHHDRNATLRSVAGMPTPDVIENERDFRTYVHQLAVIDAPDEDILSAINDFLRASTDRTAWAERGYIDSAMLDAFSTELQITWRNCRQRTSISHKTKSPQERGMLLFLDCNSHTARPGGLDCPPHFTRGSFHALAEDETIGWHPDYASELRRLREQRNRQTSGDGHGSAQP